MVPALSMHSATAARYVSPETVAAELDVTVATVRNWIRDGRLTGYRLGPRLVRVDAREVEALLRPITDGGDAA